MKTRRIPSPLKYHGGKSYLAPKLIPLVPPHLHYVEPYAGGLSVLLAKDPEGVSEVVNDLSGDLMNFWKTLQRPTAFKEFLQRAQATPFSEAQWQEAAASPKRAFNFFVACRQSLAGRGISFAPISRNRVRRGMNEQAAAWLSAIEGLPEVHARLKRVVILNRPALDVIRQQDSPNTFFYLDPPYMHETRSSTDDYGMFEMDEEDHRNLLHLLGGIEGDFMLSGYDNPLYRSYARRNSWTRKQFNVPNNAAGGKTKRRETECVWMNY